MALLNHQRPLWALLAAAPLIATVSTSASTNMEDQFT
jgi:general secretion pathway protein D